MTGPAALDGHVVLVGAGGIGCPALWGLVAAGVSRITVVDLDRVEVSNLPRQVLFAAHDVGQPKAQAAVEAFADAPGDRRAVHARMDDATFGDLTRAADVLIDATDGARTKDWLNHAAVHARLPLVHAAGLRSEARMLVVPPGGQPCLACLFGRLEQETGSCADLGVWNGVVGVIGFLAATAAVRVLEGNAPSPSYDVFDFDARRALSLEASADASCPVCHAPAQALETFPEATACAPAPPHQVSDIPADRVLDLREVRCPMNLLRARQALGNAPVGSVVEFHLGEEGAATVPDGVERLGHEIVHDEPRGSGRLLRVRAASTERAEPLSAEHLERFARQLVLPDLGEAGQRRLGAAHVVVQGDDTPARVAERYLTCAGVGSVSRLAGSGLTATVDDVTWRAVREDAAVVIAAEGAAMQPSLAGAALLADRVQRHIVAPDDVRPSLPLAV